MILISVGETLILVVVIIFLDVLGGCSAYPGTSLVDQILCVQQVISELDEQEENIENENENKKITKHHFYLLSRKWFALPNPGLCLPLVSFHGQILILWR